MSRDSFAPSIWVSLYSSNSTQRFLVAMTGLAPKNPFFTSPVAALYSSHLPLRWNCALTQIVLIIRSKLLMHPGVVKEAEGTAIP
jgi:hypothetical protein